MRLDIIKQAEIIAAMDFQVLVDREDDHEGSPIYVAHIAEIPECAAQGASPEQAQAELREILVDVIRYMLESGIDVPQPRARAGRVARAQAG